MQTHATPGFLFMLILAIGCASPPSPDLTSISLRSFITTGLDENGNPINDVSTVTLGEDKEFYLYVIFVDIPQGNYDYRYELYDSTGQQIYLGRMALETDGSSWHTSFGYSLLQNVEVPGRWMLRVYLDDVLMLQRRFEVAPGGDLQSKTHQSGCEARAASDEHQDVPILRVDPAYPQSAIESNIAGSTKLSFLVQSDGSVSNIEIIESNPEGVFDDAAVKAVSQWKYCPERVDELEYENPKTVKLQFQIEP